MHTLDSKPHTPRSPENGPVVLRLDHPENSAAVVSDVYDKIRESMKVAICANSPLNDAHHPRSQVAIDVCVEPRHQAELAQYAAELGVTVSVPLDEEPECAS